MLRALKENLSKRIGIELVNGSKVFGVLLDIDDKSLRIDTEEGIASVLIESVLIVWKKEEDILANDDLNEIVEKVKDIENKRYVCLGANGFRCPQSYICRPPHACNNFACPGAFSSGFVPPDEPCVGQFFGFKRSENSSSSESEKSKEGTEKAKE